MVEKVPKVTTGKKVERWLEARIRSVLGLFHPNTVEAKDRPGGTLEAL